MTKAGHLLLAAGVACAASYLVGGLDSVLTGAVLQPSWGAAALAAWLVRGTLKEG